MVLGDGDQDLFLTDAGEPVTIGGVAARGIFDMPGTLIENAAVDTNYSILGKTSDFGNAPFGAPAVIRGEQYSVINVVQIDDGVFCRVSLAKL